MKLTNQIRTGLALLRGGRPFVLFHKPTARCDCRCKFCDSWISQPEADDTLPSDLILDVLDRAARAGFTTYTVWGGEPLLVKALPEWLARARSHGMQTVVCTSAYRLSERADEVAPHIERLLVSLEALGERLNKIRGTAGLFERVVSGIADYRRAGGGQITVWSNLTRENMDQVEALAGFARDQGLLIEFFPARPFLGCNEKLVLDHAEGQEVFARVKDLKRRGFPVNNTNYSLDLMDGSRPFRCNIPRLSVQVNARGEIWPCESRTMPGFEPLGNIENFDFNSLAGSETHRRLAGSLSSCNRCLLPCVGHLADGLILQAMRKAWESR
jgi:MoaA/NifB/PqqE/SkfB family radical SAM enzyme